PWLVPEGGGEGGVDEDHEPVEAAALEAGSPPGHQELVAAGEDGGPRAEYRQGDEPPDDPVESHGRLPTCSQGYARLAYLEPPKYQDAPAVVAQPSWVSL